MKTYHKFVLTIFFKSFIFVSLIMISLVIILNILSELEFFRNTNVNLLFPIYLSLLNSPSLMFEMFPFIFLVSTQLFFINLFSDNQIQIFKYSGLKNSKILMIISLFSLFLGIIIITLYYSFSSNLKNFYLELKNNYTADDKYLAVVTKNGLWIKDNLDGNISIINASEINNNYLIDTFISQFDENYEILKNIHSKKIDISKNEWVAYDVKIYTNNQSEDISTIILESNFNYQKIQSLFSNLSSLSILKLIDLRENYKSLNYSIVEVDLELNKIISYPIYLTLMTILSSIIMFNIKRYSSTTFKISIGLFLSVIIYYVNNFFYVMGKTEKFDILISIWAPLSILLFLNFIMFSKINEK
ncbi:LptF/LptG family permease [Candidatus Pelagibacter sp.]|nr:LptF/LptG family permease [Candidatus Pelagibacter sp.]